ncbi:MAG TPA: type II toxin-antitoxin system RelE/ParE family toxin, partial [Verrucomicrobiae bacterium]|nr:type II toxin-antitoxin system RelE/ParE family toxin [Verrucomicrobiae bacterium]
MRRQIIFGVEARIEFEDAVEWHNKREPGLGDRFAEEVKSTIQSILKNPEHFPLEGKVVRRAPVKIFKKYSVL